MLTVLRNARDFRLLRVSQSISTIGDALVLVAVGLFVTRLTGDPSDVGAVLGAVAMSLALLPRSTRRLERWESEPSHEGLLPPVASPARPSGERPAGVLAIRPPGR